MPAFLTNLLDPAASVDLPPGPAAAALRLDNRELDKLVAALGRSRATWRRALMLHEWRLAAGHALPLWASGGCGAGSFSLQVCKAVKEQASSRYPWRQAPAT